MESEMEEIREVSTVESMLGEHRGLEASTVESEMEEIREASPVELMLGGHRP